MDNDYRLEIDGDHEIQPERGGDWTYPIRERQSDQEAHSLARSRRRLPAPPLEEGEAKRVWGRGYPAAVQLGHQGRYLDSRRVPEGRLVEVRFSDGHL